MTNGILDVSEIRTDKIISKTGSTVAIDSNPTGSGFVSSSTGVADAGKGVLLDLVGKVDNSMINQSGIDHVDLANIGTNTHAQIDTHIADNSNPHSVTAAQVGAYNTSEFINTTTGAGDAGKPIKTDAGGLVDNSFLPSLPIAEQNKVIVNNLADFPAPVANVITLTDGKDYRISGVVNIGINRIVFGDNCGITGDNPQNDILVYEGVGSMFTAINQNLILLRIGISCDAGTLFDATDIDYTIDPSVDPFQGRSKRFYVFNCNLIGGVAGNGSNLGAVEGFGTVNFNANLIRSWDAGFKMSNGLSFQGLNNKSVLWNGQGATMFTLRDNNWSGQTGGAGSYIPAGINALNFNGNILHPRTADYGINIEPGSTTVSGNVSGNIFLSTGLTTGGTFNPASLGYNDLPTYNIQGNQGIADNTATIQASSNKFSNIVTTINAQNVPVKLNLDNTIKTSENLLFSSRILVTSAATFEEGQIITGGTSTYTGKIQSIDLPNNYIYVEYVIDGAGASQFFTVGETITSLTASTTYNGIDGSYKYYGFKDISTRLLATITMEKVLNGRDIFEIIPYKNGIALSEISAIQYLEQTRPMTITCQGIIDFIQDDILEIYIQNVDSNDNSECQSYVLNISAR
jgi:hypothetical protein